MSFHDTVEEVRRTYAVRDDTPDIARRWAPFSEGEVEHRSRQYWALAELLREVGRLDLTGMKVLDLGCGRGRQLRSFLDMGARPGDLTGLEIRAEMVALCGSLSPNIDVRIYDGASLPFPDNSFDLVTQFVVFSSIPSPELRKHLAREMIRVLNPRGFVFWWDKLHVGSAHAQEVLDPSHVFERIPARGRTTALLPAPSACILQSRYLWWLRRLADTFALPPSHRAYLIGPKAAD